MHNQGLTTALSVAPSVTPFSAKVIVSSCEGGPDAATTRVMIISSVKHMFGSELHGGFGLGFGLGLGLVLGLGLGFLTYP